jgi:hypothetical protein
MSIRQAEANSAGPMPETERTIRISVEIPSSIYGTAPRAHTLRTIFMETGTRAELMTSNATGGQRPAWLHAESLTGESL